MSVQNPAERAAAVNGGQSFTKSIIEQAIAAMNQTGTADENSRLYKAMPAVLRHVHELVDEIQLTEPELMAFLGYLGKIAENNEILLLSDVFGVSVHANHNSFGDSHPGSPPSVEGPYYLEGAEDKGPEGNIASDDEPGLHLYITGQVTNALSGKPVSGAVLDFWQTDDAAIYDIDGYHLRGNVKTDASGRYKVHTIKPKGYAIGTEEVHTAELMGRLGRTSVRPAHLHAKVCADGYQELTTQIFFAGDPLLNSDAIFAVKKDQVVDPKLDSSGKRASFDFDLQLVPTAR